MLMYALIGISLVLLGVAGLQFTYMFYIDRVYRERKKYMQELQQNCLRLEEKLKKAEQRLTEQDAILSALSERDDEAWADVIGDR